MLSQRENGPNYRLNLRYGLLAVWLLCFTLLFWRVPHLTSTTIGAQDYPMMDQANQTNDSFQSLSHRDDRQKEQREQHVEPHEVEADSHPSSNSSESSDQFSDKSTNHSLDGVLPPNLSQNVSNEPRYTRREFNLMIAEAHRDRVLPKSAHERFKDLLDRYEKLHADIVAGRKPQRWVIWWCRHGNCEGWADRLKGIMSAVTIGLITDRAVLVDLTMENETLSRFYEPRAIRWDLPRPDSKRKFRVGFFNGKCYMAVKGVNNPEFAVADLVEVHGNLDCSGTIISNYPEFKNSSGIGELGTVWRSLIMERFFPASQELESHIEQAVPEIPMVAMHYRTGWIPNDKKVFHGTTASLVQQYTRCFEQTAPESPAVYLTGDNSDVMTALISALSNKTRVYTAETIGGIGHVQRNTGVPNMMWRLFVDFEVIRRTPILLAASSGFSLFAHKLRRHPEARVFMPLKGCRRVLHDNVTVHGINPDR